MGKEILEGIKVLDLADVKGQLCGKILADLGADVIKIEPPEGDKARRIGPFKGDKENIEGSLYFANFNTNKKSLVLDVLAKESRSKLEALIRSSDVLIENFLPEEKERLRLDYASLVKLSPGLIVASVTGFGESGPYKNFHSSEIVTFAMGGQMNLCGNPDEPPLMVPCEASNQLACVFGAYGVLLALSGRQATGQGQQVEISAQEAQAAQQHQLVNYTANSDIIRRQGSIYPMVGAGAPYGIYKCKDGYLQVAIIVPAHWEKFLDMIGRPDALTDPIFKNRHQRIANSEFIDSFVLEFLKSRTKKEVYEEAQRIRITIVPVQSPGEYINDPQTQFRRAFVELQHPYLGKYSIPRAPYLFSESPCRIARPAPLLGQDNAEIEKIIKSSRKSPPDTAQTKISRRKMPLPLAGIRILDFSFAIAGPLAGRLLGEFGAEIIRVESSVRPDRGRIGPDMHPRQILQQRVTYADINRNKKSITLNMTSAKGREIAKTLVKSCDVVLENFSPTVMEKWGMSYPELKKIKKDIVMVRLSGFGATGPRREAVGLAPNTMALSGLFHIWGYPGGETPIGSPIWLPDVIHAVYGSLAVVAAIMYRNRTGQGQVVDLAQSEAMATFLGPAYLDYIVNGREGSYSGNRSKYAAPHGCYRCQGDDRWCAIAVGSEQQWQAFCQALNSPAWTKEPKFATIKSRVKNFEELDKNVEAWTREHTPHQVMTILQKAGVPAGVVQSGEDLFLDPHLRERGFIVRRTHPDTGPIEYPGVPVRLSRTPGVFGPWDRLGEHNEDVLTELAGLSREEIRRLVQEGVIC